MESPSAMEPLIAALLRPSAYDHPVEQISLLQTHISWILLTGSYAYKIKKPVDLGFLDFSTLAKRRHFCREELRLNRRLAPQLYLGLSSIRGPAAQASFAGVGAEIEVAVRMRQFRQEDLLPALLKRGLPQSRLLALVDQLAEHLACFHAAAAIAPTDSSFGTTPRVLQPALANLAALERILGSDRRLPPLYQWCRSEAERLQERFEQRRRDGRVREGHGDLHLGNLVLHEGQIVVFDCLEFSDALRWIDVSSDLAFLAMDLRRHRQSLLAAALLNRWLDHSGDYGSLATWRWYLAYRALVRAKVTAMRLEQLGSDAPQADLQRGWIDLQAYLHLAGSLQRWSRPVLLITHGVSGSGKSHQARLLAQALGWLHLRSDVERLRLFGRWGEAIGPLLQGDAYAPAVSERLYRQRLSDCCGEALAAGLSLICDATFLMAWQRRHFRELAERHGARFAILSCSCTAETALRRMASRLQAGGDPSEADAAVLEHQLVAMEPLTPEERRLSLLVPSGVGSADPGQPSTAAPGSSTDLPADSPHPDLLRQLRQLI
ncbi:MAG: AAA family ATPase [Synechococcaceae cyanobacterium]|nr:AAA family ATPase [Synechococcaceae cyanobacterium]